MLKHNGGPADSGPFEVNADLDAVSDLDEAGRRFERLTGRPARASPLAQSFDLDRGTVDLVTAATFSLICPHLPIPSLPFIGAYGISVRSLEAAQLILNECELSVQRHGSTLIAAFPEELGCGAWIFSGSMMKANS